MSDLEQLRHLADRVTAPPYEAISAAARRRERRTATRAVALALTTVGLLAAGVLVVRDLDLGAVEPVRRPTISPSPLPSEKPTPSEPKPESLDSMTPEEVVTAADAELESVAVMPGDPDVRISMWHALCHWCPDRPDGRGGTLGPPTFTGMALTTDGYETATYVRHSFTSIVSDVLSPRDDLFLVVDSGNGREWTVGLDGDVRRVQRVATEIRPTDPRLWFECGRAGGVVTTWCSLDPDTATAYLWPEEWDRSTVSPNGGEQPWGSTPSGGTYEHPGALVEAWWYDDGERQSHQLGTDVMGGGIIGTPEGQLAYWVWRPGDDAVELHTSQDRGATWGVESRQAYGLNRWLHMTRSPDGALLAWTYYPHLVVWRAEASGGGFRRVHEVEGSELAGTGLLTQDDVVYANGYGTAALSADGGLTWTTIETWR